MEPNQEQTEQDVEVELNEFDALLGLKLKIEKELQKRYGILELCKTELPEMEERIDRIKDLLMFLKDQHEIYKRDGEVVPLAEYSDVVSMIEINKETLSATQRELEKARKLQKSVERVISSLEGQLKTTQRGIDSWGKVLHFDKQRSKETPSD